MDRLGKYNVGHGHVLGHGWFAKFDTDAYGREICTVHRPSMKEKIDLGADSLATLKKILSEAK